MKQSLRIHFISEIFQMVEEGVASEQYTAEVIFKNQVVVSKEVSEIDDNDRSATAKQIELIPGNNTALSEDGKAIKALVTGYPFMEQRQSGKVLSVQVDMIPLVHVQADRMRASLTLYPALSDRQVLQPEELRAILTEAGINYGIDRAMLIDSVRKLAAARRPLHDIPVARGILPIDGKNAVLRFEVEIGPIPGTILRDGTIDFRERKIFTGVVENQLIAVRVPETAGSPGINVLGESIPQQPGKGLRVKVSGDASYSEETGQVVATRSGVVSAVRGTDIKVSAKQIIPGDVDFSVGNIESKASVDIHGSVHPGFSVKTKGDLRIGGNIDGAAILCKGNAVVVGGLLGANSRLETLGDADINFIERAEVLAGGRVVIRKGAYYSKITGDGDIFCSPESKMVGCVCCCAGNFVGGDVGSSQGLATTVAAGVDGKRYTKYKNLKQQILEVESQLEILRIRKGNKSSLDDSYRQYQTDLQELQADFRKLNLIPDTPPSSRNEPAFNLGDGRITIHGTAATGTKLRIGNLTKVLEYEYSAVEFLIDENLGQIVARKL